MVNADCPVALFVVQNFYRRIFYVLFTFNLGSVLVNDQLDVQLFFSFIIIPILYMFRGVMCPSSRESIVLLRHLVYVNYVGDRLVCRFGRNCSTIQTCTLDGHLHSVTYTRCHINITDSPDDEHKWCSKHVENWNKYI
jgi:hypothetical protein